MRQYGIRDESTSFTAPQFDIPEEDVQVERKLAEYANSEEYRALADHLQERKVFYQRFLPDGREVTSNVSEKDWLIANAIIREIDSILTTYANIAEAYKDVK